MYLWGMIICYRVMLYMQLNYALVLFMCLSGDHTIIQAVNKLKLPLTDYICLYKDQILVEATQIELLPQTSQNHPLHVRTEIKLWIQLNDKITATEHTLKPTSTLSFLSTNLDTILVSVDNRVLDSKLYVYQYSLLTSQNHPLRVGTEIKLWIQLNDEITATEQL